jgi:hypothetical protein
MATKPSETPVAAITLRSLLKLVKDDEAEITLGGKKLMLKIDFEQLNDAATVSSWDDISDETRARAEDADDLDDDIEEDEEDFDEFDDLDDR